MNRSGKRDAPCILVDELPFDAPAGHTQLDKDANGRIIRITFGCPCGCGQHYGGSGWTVTENNGKFSSTPSFGCYPSRFDTPKGPDGFHWHGFLNANVFEEC